MESFYPESRYKKLYMMLMDAIPSSVLLVDRHIRVILANRNFLEKSRRKEEDTIQKHIEEVFPPVILVNMKLIQRIHQVFATGMAIHGERVRYRAPGVPLRIYYYSIIPVSWAGATENVMLLMEDITKQIRLSEDVQRVERHLASVVECASDFVVSTDHLGRIISWNGAVERATGYHLDEVKNHFFFDYFISQHQDKVRETFRAAGRLEWPSFVEWCLQTTDGQIVPVSWVFSTMKNDPEKVDGIVAVGRDLTERRKLEAQILQTQKLAALGVMAGGIAHEIRNPLAAASSAAQFLMEDDFSRDLVMECATRIHSGIQRASTIIENLLRFARPSVKKTDMEFVDLDWIIKDTLALVANDARLQKIELLLKVSHSPLMVSGRSSMLQQLLMNLVLNALNAMPSGGRIIVSLEREKGVAVIRISDTGCGIPQSDLDKIFDPFYTTLPVGQGTGLGLSICYSIVKQHFGAIEVESVEGKGSTFTISLPSAES